MGLDVVPASKIDLEAYGAMQREAFKGMLAGHGVSVSFMVAEYYRWKYHPPAGEARIAVVRKDGEMVASNAMTPYLLRRKEEAWFGWQSTDTATVPGARRKGYFAECLNGLNDLIRPGELFFGFPNQNSIHGFKKLGWVENGLVSIWICPSLFWPSPSGDVAAVSRFGESVETFAKSLAGRGRLIIGRSLAYLNWRYIDHPVYRYEVFLAQDKGVVTGFLVVREAEVRSRKFCMIMELWGSTLSVKSKLAGAARRWARKKGIGYVALFDNRLPAGEAVRLGFFRVPTGFLPKRHVLMGAGKGEDAQAVMRSSWTVQLGDWDGF